MAAHLRQVVDAPADRPDPCHAPTSAPHRVAAVPLTGRRWIVATLALLVAWPVAAQQRGGDQPPQQVGTVTAALSAVPQSLTLPGRAVAYEVAAVRPRVGGVVEAITYQPNTQVQAGTPMFRLETATLDAALASAEAAQAGAAQALDSARATVERYRALVGSGVSRVDLESAEVALGQAEAALALAQANRQTAMLDRERAVIAAPITGEAGRTDITIGGIVTANQTDPLTTVTRIDPIYVDVAASSVRLLRARQSIRAGEMTAVDPPHIVLTLEDGTDYRNPGEVVSTGSTVSTTTGTLDMRLQFPNPDRLILPGQFLRVSLTLGQVSAVLVPQRATTRAADGSLTVFVIEDGRAREVTLTEAGVWQNAWAVTAGVQPGDALIVDGLGNLRDGEAVDAVPVMLDEDGVVLPAEAAGQGGAAMQPQADEVAADRTGPRATATTDSADPVARKGWVARLKSALGLDGAQPAGAAAPDATAPAAAAAPRAATLGSRSPAAAAPG